MFPNLRILCDESCLVGIGLGDDNPVKGIPRPRLFHGMFKNECEWKTAYR